MNTISDGAHLKELAGKCGNNQNELSLISISMNKKLNNLTEKINTQIDIVDNNISVTYSFLYW